MQTCALMSVVRNFYELKKFNLRSITNPDAKDADDGG